MNLPKYILRRIVLMIPTLFGITLVCFVIVNLAPGGPIEQRLQKIRFSSSKARGSAMGFQARSAQGVSEEVLQALKKQYGFDKPMMTRYGLWLKNLARLDLGESFTYGRPAVEVIKERFPVSLQFGFVSFVLSYFIAIGLGLIMAMKSNRGPDAILSSSLIVASSIPAFMLAILLLVFFAGGSFLNWFPLGYLTSEDYVTLSAWGKIKDRLHHFALPLFCYMIGSFTTLALLVRNTLVDEACKEYIQSARARGLSEKTVYLKHALRNALIPVVTGLGGAIAMFLGGSVLVEATFQLNGIGKLGYEAVLFRDYNLIMALIFIFSLLLLAGNLISDILYRVVDPRIDFSAG